MLAGGNFRDQLGIANVVDRDQVRHHVGLLQALGAEPLTLARYLTEHVPRATAEGAADDAARWRLLVIEIARHIDEVADAKDVRAALVKLPLVECKILTATVFLPAAHAYFPSKEVTGVLGHTAPLAVIRADHQYGLRSLYEWLGVARKPRLEDVIVRVRELVNGMPTKQARGAIAAIVEHLAPLAVDRHSKPPAELETLRALSWLPLRGDPSNWHVPRTLNTTFREYLFRSQGRFLDLPRPVQNQATGLLGWLGVVTEPTAAQLVDHVLHAAEAGVKLPPDIYTTLNRHADDPSVQRLQGKKCLQLPDGSYVSPGDVFLTPHSFGRFRHQLDTRWDIVAPLLTAIGVKPPDHNDALGVLLDLAREFNPMHDPVPEGDDQRIVWHCWRMLDDSLASGAIDGGWLRKLGTSPVIPNADWVLTPASRVLIDDRPGIATSLDLGATVIQRPERVWRAMEAAGVRRLSDAARVEITADQDRRPGAELSARVHERRPALVRALDTIAADGISVLDATLAALTMIQVSTLRIRYHFDEFRVHGRERDEAALLWADPKCPQHRELIVTVGPEGIAWLVVAKELARALFPDLPPGQLSSLLGHVLGADNLQKAHQTLDMLGLPRLDEIDDATVTAVVVEYEGTGDDLDDLNDLDLDDDESAIAEAIDDTPESRSKHGPPTATLRTQREPGTLLPGSSVAAGSGSKVGQPRDSSTTGATRPKTLTPVAMPTSAGHQATPNGQDPGTDHAVTSGNGSGSAPQGSDGRQRHYRPPTRTRSQRLTPRGRLRSYVAPDSLDGEAGKATGRSPVDIAGVEAVLKHERRHGRNPQEMKHNNPGFDIISGDPSVGPRHIEVKSTAGPWDDYGVGMSRTQYEYGATHPEVQWLYVVEYALDPTRTRVTCIHNPVALIAEYRFDDVWTAVAERDDDTCSAPTLGLDDVTPYDGYVPLRSLLDERTDASDDRWIPCDLVDVAEGWFAVPVRGHALEPHAAPGDVAIIAPLNDTPAQPGELLLVQLDGAFDADSRSGATLRYWTVETDADTGQPHTAVLAGCHESGVNTIEIDSAATVPVGRVMQVLSSRSSARPDLPTTREPGETRAVDLAHPPS